MPEAEAPVEGLSIQAQRWLEKYGNPDGLTSAREAWERFASNATTTTVFGGYDSGKSSLLRRLLVDADVPVPDWLTISARHETFSASDIGYRGVVLRDTPGVSPDSSDVRGETNTATALEAIKATDVLLVVVTSQLLTGERELVSTVLDLPWEDGSLWFVISRFDEAGVDPEGDMDGYRRLAESKTRELADELRVTLGRDLATRVFVASPDPYGIAGAEQQPDPAIWDPYRSWDGMQEIVTSLAKLDSSAQALRRAAATRYWLTEVRAQLAGIGAQDAEIHNLERTSEEQRERVNQWSARLRELRASARNDLNSALGVVVDQALTSSVLTEAGLKTRLSDALAQWLERHNSELNLLVQDLELQLERQLERPSWKGLTDLIDDLSVDLQTDAPKQDEEGIDFATYKKHLLELNKDLVKTTTDLKKLFETKAKSSGRVALDTPDVRAESFSKAGRLFKGVDVATTVIPFAIDALHLINKYNDDAAQAEAAVHRRKQIETELEVLKSKVIGEVGGVFEGQCDELAAVLDELAGSVDEVSSSLSARRRFCDEARKDAESLFEPS